MERCTDHNISSAVTLSTLTSCAPCATLPSPRHSWCRAPTGEDCFYAISMLPGVKKCVLYAISTLPSVKKKKKRSFTCHNRAAELKKVKTVFYAMFMLQQASKGEDCIIFHTHAALFQKVRTVLDMPYPCCGASNSGDCVPCHIHAAEHQQVRTAFMQYQCCPVRRKKKKSFYISCPCCRA